MRSSLRKPLGSILVSFSHCVLQAKLLLGWEIKKSPNEASLFFLLKISKLQRLCKFFMTSDTHHSAHVSALPAAVDRHLGFIPLIGGGFLVHFGACTPQVRRWLTVYTSLCTQPSSPLCDWFTQFACKSSPQCY